MKKLVVVEVINELMHRAGAEVFFCDLCSELKLIKSVDLHVVVLFDDIHTSFRKKLMERNISIHTLSKKRGFDFKASKKFRDLINKINPDVINSHLNVMSTYFLAFGLKKRKWKLVHTVHNIANKEVDFVGRIVRPFYIKKNIISFIGISDKIGDSIKEMHKNAEVKTVYNGINLVKIEETNKMFYDFICVARFTPQKNHELLVKDFDKYFSFKQTLKSNEKITLMQPVNNVYNLLLESRIFILTSLFEGNPISILEAMNAGLPIIAPRVGGIPDIVSENENGLLFDVNNSNQLFEAMEKIYCNNVLYDKIREKNRSKISLFNIEKVAEEYLLHFENVLKS